MNTNDTNPVMDVYSIWSYGNHLRRHFSPDGVQVGQLKILDAISSNSQTCIHN